MAARPCILVDTREQAPLVFSDAVDVERATLPSGDYSVTGSTERVAIERKSLPDLVACVGPERERFLDCCRRLQGYPLRLLVVEAALDDVLAGAYRSKTNPSSVIGTTLAIFTDYGLPTLWCGNARNAARMVEKILVRVWRKHVQEVAAA